MHSSCSCSNRRSGLQMQRRTQLDEKAVLAFHVSILPYARLKNVTASVTKAKLIPSSLRDYWLKPTRFPAGRLPELTRRTALSVITPSLWEPPPMLTTLSASTRTPGDGGTPAVSAFTPQVEAADVSEKTLTPHLLLSIRQIGSNEEAFPFRDVINNKRGAHLDERWAPLVRARDLLRALLTAPLK